jgi:hypothetical protein
MRQVATRALLHGGFLLDLFFYSEDGIYMLFRHVGWFSTDYMALCIDKTLQNHRYSTVAVWGWGFIMDDLWAHGWIARTLGSWARILLGEQICIPFPCVVLSSVGTGFGLCDGPNLHPRRTVKCVKGLLFQEEAITPNLWSLKKVILMPYQLQIEFAS